MPLPQKKLIPGILLALMIAALAAPPLWWGTGDPPVIVPGVPQNNHGPANIGQAKHMAKSALDALRTVLPAVADQIEADLVGNGKPIPSWAPPANQAEKDKNHAPLLIGQLKAIADPFYTRLHAAAPAWLEGELNENQTKDACDPSNYFPWSTETTDDQNKAIANIGQLKAVFSLRFEQLETDHDRLADEWEILHFLNLRFDASADPDNDGLSNLQEMTMGSDPKSEGADTDQDGMPDDWEFANAGTFAIYPPVLTAQILADRSASSPLMLRNDTDAPINFSISISDNRAPVYSHADSLTGGVPFVWEDISATGTLLSVVSGSDDGSEEIPGGFEFDLFGHDSTSVFVCSNGFLTLGESHTDYSNRPLPDPAAPPRLIAPFWDDLNPGSGGDIYYQRFADRLIVQFQEVRPYSGSGTYTFQAVLYATGEIEFRYHSMTGATDSCTVGLQDSSGLVGLEVASGVSYPATGISIRFSHPDFCGIAPLTGTIPAHSASSVAGTFHSLSLPAGQHTAQITVSPDGEGNIPRSALARLTVLDDEDSDGIPDAWEIQYGLEPGANDASGDPDRDGYTNLEEYQKNTDPLTPDNTADADNDGMWDRWESLNGLDPNVDDSAGHADSDGLTNLMEFLAGTKPGQADSDSDGMPDDWEIAHSLNPLLDDSNQDADGDGLTNLGEYQNTTDPQTPNDTTDLDDDGMLDTWELAHGLDPAIDDSALDPDKDGLTNLQEFQLRTNPIKPDTDGDELPDGWEHDHQLDPNNRNGINGAGGDLEPDGLVNLDEFLHNTDPNDADTDDDGTGDKEEVDQVSNPNDPSDGGLPPKDLLEELEFKVGGDYASWRMEIQGMGPRDTRKLFAISPKHGEWKIQKHKLWRNNKYEITLHHTGSKPDVPDEWYCWEARVDDKPNGDETFEVLPGYELGERTAAHKYVVVNKYWIADNRDGLLTPHLHSKGSNKAGGLKATLMPVEFRLRNAVDVDQGWDDTRPENDPDEWASIGPGFNDIVRLFILGADVDIGEHCELYPSLEDQGMDICAGNKTVKGTITDFRIYKNASEKEGEIIVREKANHTNTTAPLKAFACATRTVKVGIYRIVDSDIPSTDQPDEGGEPWIDTADTDYINLLNSVYQKQAGITFELDPSSRKVDVKGTDAYNEDGEVEFDINQPLANNDGLNDITLKVEEKVEADNLSLPKLRIYLVKRLMESTDEDIVGVNYGRHCFANRYDHPITIPHEVGHALKLSTEGKGQGGTHDEGPWPEELSDEGGLMAEDGHTKWLRREDWKEATRNAGDYE